MRVCTSLGLGLDPFASTKSTVLIFPSDEPRPFMKGDLTDVNASVSNKHPRDIHGRSTPTTRIGAESTLAGSECLFSEEGRYPALRRQGTGGLRGSFGILPDILIP